MHKHVAKNTATLQFKRFAFFMELERNFDSKLLFFRQTWKNLFFVPIEYSYNINKGRNVFDVNT